MASIMGFQLKNIKSTFGREGYGCVANMYLNGKKIGTYEDYGNGALGNESYVSKEDEKAMVQVIIEYAKKHPDEFIVDIYRQNPEQYESAREAFRMTHPYVALEDLTMEVVSANSIDYIVSAFLDLHDIEKKFKSYQKKGYGAVSVKDDVITAYPVSFNEEQILKEADGGTIYRSLADFVQ